jgi:hypothetical protein
MEVNGVTTIEFVRKMDTGDDKDNPIPKNGTLKIIWGLGGSDSFNDMHTRVGYGTIDIASGETTSEETVELWPIHAIFMTIGVVGMATGWLAQYRKKWKGFMKYHIYVMSGSVISGAIGLAIGFIMVESNTGVHLRVPHSWLGLLALIGTFTALGLGLYFKYTKNVKHKKPTIKTHKWVGRTGAGAFILVAGSGFYQAIVIGGSEPPAWFVAIMMLSVLVLIGLVSFLIVKSKPTPKPAPAATAKPPEKKEEVAPEPMKKEVMTTEKLADIVPKPAKEVNIGPASPSAMASPTPSDQPGPPLPVRQSQTEIP